MPPSSNHPITEGEYARIINIGPLACASMANFALRIPCRLHMSFVDIEGSMAIPEGSDFAVLECPADAPLSTLRSAASKLLPVLLPPDHHLDEANATLVVCDLSSSASLCMAMELVPALKSRGVHPFIVALTPMRSQGNAAIAAAKAARRKLKILECGMLVIEGTRMGALDSLAPYLHHACQILTENFSSDCLLSSDVKDVQKMLSGSHSHMGYAQALPGPCMARDLVEQVLRGLQLTEADLHQARYVFIVVEAPGSQIKLSETRDCIQQLMQRAADDAETIFSFVQHEAPDGMFGMTVMASG